LDLATYLREHDIAEPVFVIYFDNCDGVLSQLKDADIDYLLHPRYLIEKAPLLGQIVKLLRDGRFSRGIARRLPDIRAMVCTVETHQLEYALIPGFNKRGINTIVLQWAQSGGKEYYQRVRSENEKPSLARKLRGACRGALGWPLAKAMDIQLASSYGKGPAKYFAVMGEFYRELFISEGVRPAKIRVTGHPEADYLYELAEQSSRPGWRQDVASEFDLNPSEDIWLLGREAIAYFGLVPADKDEADLTAVLQILTEHAGDGQIVLKRLFGVLRVRHPPVPRREDYQGLRPVPINLDLRPVHLADFEHHDVGRRAGQARHQLRLQQPGAMALLQGSPRHPAGQHARAVRPAPG